MKHLFNEEDLRYYNPQFAKVVGLDIAVTVQRIYGLIVGKPKLAKKNPDYYKDHFADDLWWVYNTYDEWHDQEFAFWSKSKIIRVLKDAEDLGVIKSRPKLDENGERVSTWYTVIVDACEAITAAMIPVKQRKSRWDNPRPVTPETDEKSPADPTIQNETTPDIQNETGGGSSQLDKYPVVNLTTASGGGSSQLDYLTVESSFESIPSLISYEIATNVAEQPAALLSTDIPPVIERRADLTSKSQFPEKESTMGKIITKLAKEFAAKKQRAEAEDPATPKSPSKAMQHAIIQAMLDEDLWREDSMTDGMYKQAGALSKTLLKMPKPPTPDEAKDFIAYLAHLSAVQEWGSFSLYKMDKHVPAWRNNPEWRETLGDESPEDLPLEHQPWKPEYTEPGKYYNLVKERNRQLAQLFQLPHRGDQS